MPRVIYIESDGREKEVNVTEGWTVMQGATLNGVDGIEGECGGSCACATCHCYVDEAYLDKLPPIEEIEDEMLDFATSERKKNSRLGCQIKVTSELDGMIVRLP